MRINAIQKFSHIKFILILILLHILRFIMVLIEMFVWSIEQALRNIIGFSEANISKQMHECSRSSTCKTKMQIGWQVGGAKPLL